MDLKNSETQIKIELDVGMQSDLTVMKFKNNVIIQKNKLILGNGLSIRKLKVAQY